MEYQTPSKSYFRLHHIRPRFKNNVEDVLIYMASEIEKIPEWEKSVFDNAVDRAIRLFPENVTKAEKTIRNWRTEISSLFGFIEYDWDNCSPWNIAKKLATNLDLIEFFKYFLFRFQYPGWHLKPHESLRCIKAGVRFHPARFILSLLDLWDNWWRGYVNKAELTHCIFNDLRFTRWELSPKDGYKLIEENRKNNYTYDWSWDVVRYAWDILDYLVLANLLEIRWNRYMFNMKEYETILKFINSDTFFTKYDIFYNSVDVSTTDISQYQEDWFNYINQDLDEIVFKTDILTFLNIENSPYQNSVYATIDDLHNDIVGWEVKTKNIWDLWENLIIWHESMYLKLNGRKDLIKLIKKIPTHLAVWYDIQSVDLDTRKRYIEVKSTISSKKINFFNIHLTPNEWQTAETLRERYFIYRLSLSKESQDLFIIQDPVWKYKSDLIAMAPRNGADMTFSQDSGNNTSLLLWKD